MNKKILSLSPSYDLYKLKTIENNLFNNNFNKKNNNNNKNIINNTFNKSRNLSNLTNRNIFLKSWKNSNNKNYNEEKLNKKFERIKVFLNNEKNECPSGNSCCNYKIIISLKNYINYINNEYKIKKELNSYLSSLVNKNDKQITQLINNNLDIYNEYKKNIEKNLKENQKNKTSFLSNINNEIEIKNLSRNSSKISKKKTFINKDTNFINKINNEIETYNNKSKEQKFFSLNSRFKTKAITHKFPRQSILDINFKNLNANQFYNFIEDLNQKRKYKNEFNKVFFLNIDDVELYNMYNNPLVQEIFSIIKNNDCFEYFSNLSEEKKFQYKNSINFIIKDYILLLKLIIRIKKYIENSVKLNESLKNIEKKNELQSEFLNFDFSEILHNFCDLLNAEYAFIYLYDNLSDMLILFTEDKLTFKINKNEGIVGQVFLKGEHTEIEDTDCDFRYDKEFDKKFGFKSKNMIIYPLKISEESFGVVQIINKKNGNFNEDDFIFMNNFCKQASIVINCVIDDFNNKKLFEKLNYLFDFSFSLNFYNNKKEFSENLIKIFNNIFYSQKFRLYFTKENKLINFNFSNNENENKNEILNPPFFGILGNVYKTKKIHTCSSVKKCKLYNNLIDLNISGSMITFPVLISDKIIAIVQTEIYLKIKKNSLDNNLKILIEIFSKIIKNWYKINKK